MQPPYSPVGLHDLPVKDLWFLSQMILWNLSGLLLYLNIGSFGSLMQVLWYPQPSLSLFYEILEY
jgi:hypothetical protein